MKAQAKKVALYEGFMKEAPLDLYAVYAGLYIQNDKHENLAKNFYANGDNYYVRFRLNNVMYKNINRNFVCMLVLATNSGNTTTYQYSKLPAGLTYRSNARSIAYVASAALNAHTLGLDNFSETELAKLKGYVNQSVDLANGLEASTNDGSMYAFTVSPTGPKTVSVGQTFKVDVEIVPDVNVPVWYRSTDTSVVTVDDQGTQRSAGLRIYQGIADSVYVLRKYG